MTSSTAYRGNYPYSRRRGQDGGSGPRCLVAGLSFDSLVGRVHRNIIIDFISRRALVELENRTDCRQLKGTIRVRKTGTLRLAATQLGPYPV